MSLTSGSSPSTYGDSLTFTATVTGNSPGRTVQFKVDGVAVGNSVALVGGAASLVLSNLPISGSPHQIVAYYSGDNNNFISDSSGSPVSQTITPKSLTVVLTGAVSKTYDGTAAATLAAGNYSLPGVVAGDSVSLNNPPSGTYDTKNAGTGKTVSVTGLAILGSSSANYILSSTSASGAVGAINKRTLRVTAISNTRTYDGTTGAAATPTLTGSVQTGDSATWTETYDTKKAGTGKTLTPAGTVADGNGGANYNVQFVNNTSGAIGKTNLTVTAASNTKTYDGTTSAAATPALTGSIQTGDSATWTETYDTKNVGTGKTLTPAGTVADGNDGANYNVTFVNNTSGVITALTTACSLTSSVNPSGPGTNVTFTAAVNGVPAAADLPTGDVVFSANGTPFATNALVSGSISASTDSLPLGTNTMTAQYVGDGNFLGSTGSMSQEVKLFVTTCSQTNALLSIVDNLDGTFMLTFVGTPQAEYYVSASPDVAVGWAPVSGSTNTVTNVNGLWQFTVTNTASQQFFRGTAVAPCP